MHQKKREKRTWKELRELLLQALRMDADDVSPEDMAEALGMDKSNLYRFLNTFKSVEYPIMCRIVDTIRNERLLERGKVKTPAQKAMETKIKNAKKGYYVGPRRFGYTVKNSIPIEIEEEQKKARGVINGFKKGRGTTLLSKDFGLNRKTVRNILEDPIWKGEYVHADRTYKITQRGFTPILSPEEWDEIQSKLPKGPRASIFYMWKDGKRVAKPGAKEKAEKIFALRLEGESIDKIANDVHMPRTIIWKLIKNRKITGKKIIDGKKIDSGFEQLISEDIWEKAQKVHLEVDLKKYGLDTKKQNQKEIMENLPCFRWELREKTELVDSTILRHLKDLKKMIKERADGLLQRSWEPYPEKVLSTHHALETKKRKKILEVLLLEGLTVKELTLKTNLPRYNVAFHLSKLESEDIVEKYPPKPNGKYYISKEFWELVQQWLSQPHIASL